MKIQVVNEAKDMSVLFLGGDEIRALYGYEYTLQSTNKYVELTNNLLLFESANYQGFFRNRTPNNYIKTAIATDGEDWGGQRLNGNVISWIFYPQNIEQDSIFGVSPQQYINALFELDDELKVIVTTGQNKTAECYFYVLPSTDTEAGVIALSTSRSGKGIYWKVEDFIRDSYYFGMGKLPKIPFTTPQIHLTGNDSLPPFKEQFFTKTLVNPKISISHALDGEWNKFEYENTSMKTKFTYLNKNNDKKIIIDSELQTIVNEKGEDRKANWSGDFIVFSGGVNSVTWNVDDASGKYIPQDLHVTVQYEVLDSAISN